MCPTLTPGNISFLSYNGIFQWPDILYVGGRLVHLRKTLSSCFEFFVYLFYSILKSVCVCSHAGAFGQVRAPQPGYSGPFPGQQGYGAPPPAQAPPPAAKRLDPDSIPSPVHKH